MTVQSGEALERKIKSGEKGGYYAEYIKREYFPELSGGKAERGLYTDAVGKIVIMSGGEKIAGCNDKY